MYVEQMTTRDTAYNIPITAALPEDVDVERFRAAVRTVIEAHPYLRMGFGTDENGDAFKFIREEAIEVGTIETESFDSRDYIKPFDLENDVLFRPYV
ncbi:hypothetical protein IKP13_07330, partial [bacterium]|nr:hypothetical protein [bacterium]